MLALGIDPDTCDTSFGWWDDNGPVTAQVAHVIRSRAKGNHILTQTAAKIRNVTTRPGVVRIAVEGQQFDKRTKSKRDIFQLAQVAGIAIHEAMGRYPGARLFVPTPSEWKGGVAKHAHQARLYKDLGWGYQIVGTGSSRYAQPITPPSSFSHISPGQWKHVGDALLLARWAHSQR